jgi:hypothetical protein
LLGCRFEKDIIVEVRAYVDSAMVQRLIIENEYFNIISFNKKKDLRD